MHVPTLAKLQREVDVPVGLEAVPRVRRADRPQQSSNRVRVQRLLLQRLQITMKTKGGRMMHDDVQVRRSHFHRAHQPASQQIGAIGWGRNGAHGRPGGRSCAEPLQGPFSVEGNPSRVGVWFTFWRVVVACRNTRESRNVCLPPRFSREARFGRSAVARRRVGSPSASIRMIHCRPLHLLFSIVRSPVFFAQAYHALTRRATRAGCSAARLCVSERSVCRS